eukprot:gb/GECG01013642.1/.p1 GENE.gb/GECG01013642.1/~~gb/GECG01013642.1/.p1  ORF type:complete len:1427 (+),score=246.12 gb/GECG01013642.1/:1-4281(+)
MSSTLVQNAMDGGEFDEEDEMAEEPISDDVKGFDGPPPASTLPKDISELYADWSVPPSKIEQALWGWIDRGKYRYSLDTSSLFTRYDSRELLERAVELSSVASNEKEELEALACVLAARSKEAGRRASLSQRKHTTTHGKGDWRDTIPNFITLSEVMKNLREMDAAVYYCVSAAKETLKSDGHPELLNVLEYGASHCVNVHRDDAAVEIYNTELSFLMKHENTNQQKAKCYKELVHSYQRLGQLEDALHCSKTRMELLHKELSPDHPAFLQTLIVIGNISRQLGMTEHSLQYHRRVHDLLQEYRDVPNRNQMLATVDLKIGQTLMDQHRPHDARWFVSSALRTFDQRHRKQLWQARSLLTQVDNELGLSGSNEAVVRERKKSVAMQSSTFSDNFPQKRERALEGTDEDPAEVSEEIPPSKKRSTGRHRSESQGSSSSDSSSSSSSDNADLFGRSIPFPSSSQNSFNESSGAVEGGGGDTHGRQSAQGDGSGLKHKGSKGPLGSTSTAPPEGLRGGHGTPGGTKGSQGPLKQTASVGTGGYGTSSATNLANVVSWAADASQWDPSQEQKAFARVIAESENGSISQGGSGGFPSNVVPHGYFSSSTDFGISPDGAPKYGYRSYEEAAEALQKNAKRLISALEVLRAAGGTRQYARKQGDGQMAIDENDAEAVEGKTEEATRVANQVRSASQSLTASYNIPSLRRKQESDNPEESRQASDKLEQLEQLQNQLLLTMADAGDKIGEALDMRGIRSEDLRALASGQSPGSSESSEEEDDGSPMLDHNTVAYRRVRNAIRQQRQESRGTGKGNGGQGNFQPGLLRPVPNPSGRRMKAVAMTAADIFDAVKYRVMALGAFKSLGDRRRQGRIAYKMFSIGLMVKLARMRTYQRYSTIIFTIGFLMGSARRMVFRRRRAKLFALGSSRIEVKSRRRALYSTKLFSVGILLRSVRQKAMSRRAVALFAVGVFPMLLRVEGKPIGHAARKKKSGQQKSTLRQFQFSKVNKTEGTLWEGANPDANYALAKLFPDLYDMFEQKKKKTATKKEGKPKQKKQLTKFIDEGGSRRQNMSIGLAKFKKKAESYGKLAGGLIRMEDPKDFLPEGAESIDQLMSDTILPRTEEMNRALQYENPDNTFDEPELFVWHMSRVPRLEARLRCLKTLNLWEDKKAKVEESINTIKEASLEIRNGETLRKFLVNYVLPFSNALNAGNKGKVTGIKLASITKLADTKAVKDPKVTMLDYLIERIAQHEPAILDMHLEFKTVQWAVNMNEEQIKADINDLHKDRQQLEHSRNEALKQAEQDPSSRDDEFLEAVEEKLGKVQDEDDDIKDRQTKMEDTFKDACKYTAEDPKSTKKEDLFKLVSNVIQTIRNAVQKYKEKKEQEEKQRKKEEEAKRKKERKPKTPKAPKPTGNKPAHSSKISELAQSGLAHSG